jgi:hypothetical protein
MRNALLALGLLLSAPVAAQPSLVASPDRINYGGLFGVTWNNAPGKSGDWVGLYTVGTPHTNPWVWVHAEAPSYTWLTVAYLPVWTSYEFRLFCCNSFKLLGSSNYVWVQDPNYRPPPPPTEPEPLYDLSDTSWNCAADAYVGLPNPPTNNCPSPQYDGITWPSSGQVGYVVTGAPGALPYNGKIRFKFRLTGGPIKGGVEPTVISNVSIYLQRVGTNWFSGQGDANCQRMWGLNTLSLTNAPAKEYTMTTPLNERGWAGVLAGCDAGAVQATLNNPIVIGFTFGDSQSKGHGTTAPAGTRIEVIEYKIFAP